MIKKYIGVSVSLIILLAPAGLAFADDGGDSHTNSLNVSAATHVHLQNPSDEDSSEGDSTDVNDDSHVVTGSTTLPSSNGEKDGLLKHFGTTTPLGIGHHDEGSTTEEHSTTTNDHQSNEVHGNSAVSFFMRWLFGLPATTTVGDIRSTITASTTASTTTMAPVPDGFFQKFLHLFHF